MRNNGETQVDQSTLDQEKFVEEEKGHLQKKIMTLMRNLKDKHGENVQLKLEITILKLTPKKKNMHFLTVPRRIYKL